MLRSGAFALVLLVLGQLGTEARPPLTQVATIGPFQVHFPPTAEIGPMTSRIDMGAMAVHLPTCHIDQVVGLYGPGWERVAATHEILEAAGGLQSLESGVKPWGPYHHFMRVSVGNGRAAGVFGAFHAEAHCRHRHDLALIRRILASIEVVPNEGR